MADELTMPVAPFGALVVAAVLFLASLLQSAASFARRPALVPTPTWRRDEEPAVAVSRA